MPGLSGEELRFALWFLLAGFVSGFAVSTVWEWLYFRRERWSLAEMDPFRLQTPQQDPASRLPRGAVLETEGAPAIVPPLRVTDATGAPGFEVYEAPHRLYMPWRVPNVSAALSAADDAGANGNGHTAVSLPQIATLPGPLPATAEPEPDASIETAQVSPTMSPPIRPAPPRSRGLPDDLTRIPGITPQIQQRLYAAHIFTWHQVATGEADVLARIARAPAESHAEAWRTQAHALAMEHGRENASYSGPIPEDLTQIQGLAANHARTLQRYGIVTFGQLAMASPTELAALFEGMPGAAEPAAYERWLRTARLLARTASAPGGSSPVLDVEEMD